MEVLMNKLERAALTVLKPGESSTFRPHTKPLEGLVSKALTDGISDGLQHSLCWQHGSVLKPEI